MARQFNSLDSLNARMWIERKGTHHAVRESYKDTHTTLCGKFVRGCPGTSKGVRTCEDCLSRLMPGTTKEPSHIPAALLRGHGHIKTKARRTKE